MLKICFCVFFLQFSDSFIDKFTQLVPGVIQAPRVFKMETLGAFDLVAGHVRMVLKLEFQHDVII